MRRARFHPLQAALVASTALCFTAAPARAATCMYGPDGKVVHRPEGADCRDVANAGDFSEVDFAPPRPRTDGPWLEIRPGDEHLFAVEITHGRSDYGKPFRYTTYAGTQHREVVAAPTRFGAGAMERRLTLRVAEGNQDYDRTDLQRDFIRPSPNGYELVAINRFWFYQRQDVEYGAGSLILPARLQPGARWNAGAIHDEFVKIDETGSVLGVVPEVATPAGTFRDCLHVRYTTDIGSRQARLDGRAAVIGRVVRDVWFARGVGVVREHEEGRVETIQRGEKFAFTVKADAAIRGVKRVSAPAKVR